MPGYNCSNRVIRQMDFIRTELTCKKKHTNFPYVLPANKMSFFVHDTTPNEPYVHPRLDSILDLCAKYKPPLVMTQDAIWESDKTQENTSHKRAKR